MEFVLGLCAAGFVAAAAWRAGALTRGGALAAAFVGTVTIGGLGWPGALVLFAFFLPSTALSRFQSARKRSLLADVDKQGPRDAAQVIANGGVAAVCSLLAFGGTAHACAAFAGAFAAAAADTWATEIGTVFGGTPRSILTLRPMAAGLSGGVTLVGTLAELGGAMSVALPAAAVGMGPALSIALAGIVGATVDSLLGASLQSLRWCPACKRACEMEMHVCGTSTQPMRGLLCLGNDGVNLVATAVGALAAVVMVG